MLKLISFIGCVYVAILMGEGEAIQCYHCYESFNETLTIRSAEADNIGANFVRCDKAMNKWNTWTCPPKYPSCIIMLGKVKDHTEILRSCGEHDFCANYVPPVGVKVESCRECKSDLCNDFVLEPEPPVEPKPLFTFNININLNVNKNPKIGFENP